MKTLLSMLSVVAVLLLTIGCSREKNAYQPRMRERIYPKITGHNLKLRVISTRGEYYRAEGIPTIRFQLINEGLGVVAIREWKARETENIRLYYAFCKNRGDTSKLRAQDWIPAPSQPQVQGTIQRYPIELGPKNAVMVDMPMTFFPQLKKSGTIAIRGELALQSLDLQSLPVEIKIK